MGKPRQQLDAESRGNRDIEQGKNLFQNSSCALCSPFNQSHLLSIRSTNYVNNRRDMQIIINRQFSYLVTRLFNQDET